MHVCFVELQSQIKEDPEFCFQGKYDPETKQQLSQWKTAGSPRPKNGCQVKKEIKKSRQCSLVFSIRGIVQTEFVPRGQTANQKFYLEVLNRAFGRKEQIFGAQANGFSITTMHRFSPHSPCHVSKGNIHSQIKDLP